MTTSEIEKLVRPNIKRLVPYEAARHLMNEPAVLLDANENPFDSEVNRYPDPWQRQLKSKISELKGVPADNIFLGNGSDEVIDLLMRVFCEPGKDNIIITPPTYGMYKVSAGINNVQVIEAALEDGFMLDADKVLKAVTPETRIIFLCSPNNPTGNILPPEPITKILENFKGIVVIDEAYIDFASTPSWLDKLSKYEHLVIMQTLSKAYGLAGLRIGMAFCSLYLTNLLNKVKPPYNISVLNQKAALSSLNTPEKLKKEVIQILEDRDSLQELLGQFDFVKHIYPSEANFLLVVMENADNVFDYLKAEGIIVRSRSNVKKCEGCLRITVGTPEENNLLIEKLKKYEEAGAVY